MPFYERGNVRIHYEEAGSGFPLLVIPGGGLNSTIAGQRSVALISGTICSTESRLAKDMISLCTGAQA